MTNKHEIDRFMVELARIVRPKSIGAWMSCPNLAFEGRTPDQVIENGDIDKLWEMLDQCGSSDAS